jgi:hypothetical protein
MELAEQLAFLFYEDGSCAGIAPASQAGVIRYRTITTTSGEVREVDIVPIWDTRMKVKARGFNTREAQRKLNETNAQKKLERLINTNFKPGDLHISLNYTNNYLPETEEQAAKDIKNYIRRIKAYRKKVGLPEMRYIYITECVTKNGETARVHHHVIMSAMNRDIAERYWRKGEYPNCDRLKSSKEGFNRLANYLTKPIPSKPESEHTEKRILRRRWASSKNLKQPVVTRSDHKISRRQACRIANSFENYATEILEKNNPGYEFVSIEIKKSEYVSGYYIRARMHKKAGVK